MSEKATEKELLRLEREYWQAVKDRDVDTAMRLTDDPCIVAGASGVGRIDQKSFARIMSAATYTLHDFDVREPEVRMIGDDVAILAYKVHEKLTVDGKPIDLDAADASMWVRRNGRWVCALHTESVLGDPYGRDRKLKATLRV
jgi:ketosteroid isomerase-like protein